MDKHSLIFSHFQKKDQLTIENSQYRTHITDLFLWLTKADDVPNDQTTKTLGIVGNTTARIIAKEDSIAAGLEEAQYLCTTHIPLLSCTLQKKDGQQIQKGEALAILTGPAPTLLAYERTLLNMLQRMSGIATKTHLLVTRIKNQELRIKAKKNTHSNPQLATHNLQPFIAATRKTPWMLLDKKAVAMGGGLTHRLSLSDGILIKDNHLALLNDKSEKTSPYPSPSRRGKQILINADSFSLQEKSSTLSTHAQTEGVRMRSLLQDNSFVEIEVDTPDQADQLISSYSQLTTYNLQPIAILFDNFTPSELKKTIADLQKKYDCSKIIFEASGGITKDTIEKWADTEVDVLSLGSLTHSATSVDLSLEIG